MPILFLILGILLLFEIVVRGNGTKPRGSKTIIVLQFLLVMFSFFVKPVVLSSTIGIQVLSCIALCIGIRFTRKNLIPTILGTGFFLFVYLLSSLYNYELLSVMSIGFYCVMLAIICGVAIFHPYLLSNIARLSVLCSFLVDYFLIKNIGGFIVIGDKNLASFALILCYIGFVINDRVAKNREVKTYEKIA